MPLVAIIMEYLITPTGRSDFVNVTLCFIYKLQFSLEGCGYKLELVKIKKDLINYRKLVNFVMKIEPENKLKSVIVIFFLHLNILQFFSSVL